MHVLSYAIVSRAPKQKGQTTTNSRSVLVKDLQPINAYAHGTTAFVFPRDNYQIIIGFRNEAALSRRYGHDVLRSTIGIRSREVSAISHHLVTVPPLKYTYMAALIRSQMCRLCVTYQRELD